MALNFLPQQPPETLTRARKAARAFECRAGDHPDAGHALAVLELLDRFLLESRRLTAQIGSADLRSDIEPYLNSAEDMAGDLRIWAEDWDDQREERAHGDALDAQRDARAA